jgi:hypothetical protein
MDISSLIPIVGDGPNRSLVDSISHINSQILTIQQREFPAALGDKECSEVFCFYETLKSPTAQKVYGILSKNKRLLIRIGRGWSLGDERTACIISH